MLFTEIWSGWVPRRDVPPVGTFDEQGLVAMPDGLSFIEAATLSCAGLTAWNALFGLPGKKLMLEQSVLTQWREYLCDPVRLSDRCESHCYNELG